MKIRHHFPRPLGKRHPAWWAPLSIAVLGFLGGLVMVAFAILLYTNPLFLVFGVSTLTGHKITFGSGQDKRQGSSYTKINIPLPGDRDLPGKFTALHWIDTSHLRLENVQLGDPAKPFFVSKSVVLGWSWKYVFRNHRLSIVDLDRPELFIGKTLAAFPKTGSGNADDADPFETMRHIFYQIRVSHGIVWIDNLRPGLPAIPLSIGRRIPFEWTTGDLTDARGAEEQIKIADIVGVRIYSPNDPQVPVLDLGRIQVGFTWEGLARKEIDSLAVTGPTVYIGPNLFAFADVFEGRKPGKTVTASAPPNPGASATPVPSAPAVGSTTPAPPTPAPATAPAANEWVIHNVVIYNGQLRVSAFGEPGVRLPFTFRSSAQDLNLSHFEDLNLHNEIEVESHVLNYPAYKLQIVGAAGKIQFGLPPSDANANNLVNTINVDEISWDNIKAQQAWVSVTFDRTGIYGSLGGQVYGGYLNGDCSFLFAPGSPWHAGLEISGTDLQQPVQILAGSDFTLQGKVNMDLTIAAHTRQIDKTEAHATFIHGGHLEIPSVDKVMDKLPADWAPWRRDIVKNILGGFRSYDFTDGTLAVQYGIPTSTAQLNLEGNQGKRNFLLNWTQENGAGVILPSQKPPQVSVKIDKNP